MVIHWILYGVYSLLREISFRSSVITTQCYHRVHWLLSNLNFEQHNVYNGFQHFSCPTENCPNNQNIQRQIAHIVGAYLVVLTNDYMYINGIEDSKSKTVRHEKFQAQRNIWVFFCNWLMDLIKILSQPNFHTFQQPWKVLDTF